MHILASRRNDAEADWAEGRNEAEAADAPPRLAVRPTRTTHASKPMP